LYVSFAGVAFALLVVLSACPVLTVPETGDLRISLSAHTEARSLVPGIGPIEVSRYDISGDGPGSESFDVEAEVGSAPVVSSLLAGTWTVKATGRNSAGIAIVRGSVDVAVRAGQTASCDLPCGVISGDGTLALSLSWPGDLVTIPEVVATLVPTGADTEDVPLPLSLVITDSSASVISTVPNGWWRHRSNPM
jgi:hypothetical protein